MSTTIDPSITPRRRTPDRVGLTAAIAIPVAGAVVPAVLTALWHDRLPDPLQMPGTGGTDPAVSLSPWATSGVLIAVTMIVGVAVMIAAAVPAVSTLTRRVLLVAGSSVTGLLAGIGAALLRANRDLPADTAVGATLSVPWWPIGPAVFIGAVIGMIAAAGLRVPRPATAATAPPPAALPRADRPGSITVTGGASVTLLAAMITGVAVIAVGTALAVSAVWPVALFVPLIWLIAVISRYRTRVDGSEVRVSSAAMALFVYPIATITRAEATTVDTASVRGGWGVRATGDDRFMVITGSGAAVRIHTAGGAELTVTTDRAAEVAAHINAYAAQRF